MRELVEASRRVERGHPRSNRRRTADAFRDAWRVVRTSVNDVGHDAFADVVQIVRHVQRDLVVGRVAVVLAAVVEPRPSGGGGDGRRLRVEVYVRGLRALRQRLVVVSDFPGAVLPAAQTRGGGGQ